MSAAPASRADRHLRLRRNLPQATVLVAAGVLVGGAVVVLVLTAVVQLGTAAAFGALIAVGELARITLPGGRETAPVAAAGGIGYALLLQAGEQEAQHTVAQAIVVMALALLLGELPHLAVGRGPRWGDVTLRLVMVAVIAVAFRPLFVPWEASPRQQWWLVLAVMAAAVAGAWLLDTVLAAAMRVGAQRGRLLVALVDEMRAQSTIGAAIGASGMVLALACSVMGLVGIVVFIAPLLVTQVAFRRFAEVRRTYLQTVRALARVTEVGGYVAFGHSRRVSRLAVATARELGMGEDQLLELEYAALMHDIGQLSLRDPIPSGATVLAPPREQRRIAELGAAVIRETGVLDSVAELVRRQCEPRSGLGRGGPPARGSQVIKVANAFDDLVGEDLQQQRVEAVLNRLRMDSGQEYDPEVVAALARTVHGGQPGWWLR